MTDESSQHPSSPILVKEKKPGADKPALYQSNDDTDSNSGQFRFFVTPPDPSPIDKAWIIFETGRAKWRSENIAGRQSIFAQYASAVATLPLENSTEDKDSKRKDTRLQQYTALPPTEKQQYIRMQTTYIYASCEIYADNIERLNETYQRCKEMLELDPDSQDLKEWKRTLAISIQKLQTEIEAASGCGCC